MNLQQLRYRNTYEWYARRLWARASDPFRTKIDIYDRARIEHRAFPHKVKLNGLPETIHQQLARGGTVIPEGGRHHLTEPLRMPSGATLRGAHVRSHGPIPCVLVQNNVTHICISCCHLEAGDPGSVAVRFDREATDVDR